MRGLDEDPLQAVATLSSSPVTGTTVWCGIGIDGVGNIPAYGGSYNSGPAGENRTATISWTGALGMGYHYVALLENSPSSNTIGWNYGGCGIWGAMMA
jgi:hypothetical protein